MKILITFMFFYIACHCDILIDKSTQRHQNNNFQNQNNN